jgi:assimilatory nitrate reductase catalytic subunit
MGGREVGGMANLLSAHRDLGNAAHRAEVAALWGVAQVPATPGKTAVEMFQAAADGEIKALWIACTNPAQSMPDQSTVRRALQRAEFVVLQEAFATTATAAYADLLLPATTWGEKEGTVTNSERRISRVRAAVVAPGQARHDWRIVSDFGQRLARQLGRGASLLPYATPESVWLEHRESTRGRDLDITGMSYALLEQSPLQWPLKAGQNRGQPRLYTDGIFPTASGKARFVAMPYQLVAEPLSSRYPFALTTGRLRDQWHGMSRTGTIAQLFGHAAEPSVQMHAADMTRLGLHDGDLVYLTSSRGTIVVPAQGSAELARAQAFMAMHWGEESLSGSASAGRRLAGVNVLTTAACCPDSRQPELKHSAIKILKAELPWSLLAMAWLPDEQVLQARTALQRLLHQFPYASCVLFGSGAPTQAAGPARSGVLLRASAHDVVADVLLQQIEAQLGLDRSEVLRYADGRKGQRRAIHLVRGASQTTLEGFMLAGDTRSQGWIKTVLQDQLDAQGWGRALLAPGATPPGAVRSRGKQVCSCFNVTEQAISEALLNGTGNANQRLALLQQSLKCGTNCGSCVPELQRMARASMQMSAPPRAAPPRLA